MIRDERILPKIFIPDDDIRIPEQELPLGEAIERELPSKRSVNLPSIREPEAKTESIERQDNANNRSLAALLRDGTEMVTNIQVANDRREICRRTAEAELRDELLTKLQQESDLAMEKFDEIRRNWIELDNIKDPFNMNQGLEEQKLRIQELMHQKDAIIEECRKELVKADENYVLDQEKQNEDIECLVERVDRQIETMKSAYRTHLEILQKTVDDERTRLKEEINTKWQDLYDQRSEMEQSKLTKLKERLFENEQELDSIILDHEELIRSTKIKLEKDNECLQIELQKTKANVQLNTQKLNYNFEVLKQREDENVVIRNQQKKRLTRLYDTISQLRRNIKDLSLTSSTETNKLNSEIKKLQNQIKEMENSAELFADVNDLKFKKVWDMNNHECRKILSQIKDIDRTLHDQELGLNYDEIATNESLVDLNDLKSFQKAVALLEKDQSSTELPLNEEEESLEDESILKTLFNKIIDEGGFIIEDKLAEILEPLHETDSKLIKISNIFQAFEIKSSEDVEQLFRIMKKYMWCPNCDDDDVVGEGVNKKEDPECENHIFTIESSNVLPAILEFRIKQQKALSLGGAVVQQVNKKDELTKLKETISRLLDPKEVKLFWNQFKEQFPKEKEQLWCGIEYGLMEYLKVLKEREQLYVDCEQLRQQNNELNHLLGEYMSN